MLELKKLVGITQRNEGSAYREVTYMVKVNLPAYQVTCNFLVINQMLSFN